MCDKIIQQESKFFYEPGGAIYNLFIYGDKKCKICPRYMVSLNDEYPWVKYKCEGMNPNHSFELRI